MYALWIAVFISSPLQVWAQGKWYPYPVEVWDPPFDMDSPRRSADYVPLEKASKKWHLHVFFPHMKDVYWLAVNYGIASEARQLGVRMTLVHAGGYDNLAVQIRQIRESIKLKPDGMIIVSISYTGLDSIVAEIRDAGIPVIDAINGMSSPRISAKSLVSYGDMGYLTGKYLAQRHPKGSKRVRVAWFPGPPIAGWVQEGDRGFKRAASEGEIEIVAARFGDNSKAVQRRFIEEVLDRFPDIDYLVGTSVGAEAAPRILRKRGLSGKVGILSYFLSPRVLRGIKRGQIMGSPVDHAVIQGKIAVDQLVRILERKNYEKHVGPRIQFIDPTNLDAFDSSTSLAPNGFRPTYTVN